jgi:hypothetical protein
LGAVKVSFLEFPHETYMICNNLPAIYYCAGAVVQLCSH